MTDLWAEASRDVEAENRAYGLEMAKSAGAGAWGFLALARTKQEFGDRVALASDSIVRAAGVGGVTPQDLLQVFTERFALLMQAGENPFADKDDTGDGDDEDDKDDSGDDSDKDDDEHGDGQSDSSGDDDAKDGDSDKSNSDVDDAGTDETDDNGTDGGDDHEQDDDGDDNADDSDAGKDKDDDQKDDLDNRESPAFGGIYSSLLHRIEAGEDPLAWGGRPFVRSLGRTAAGADDAPVSDTNVPTPTADPGGSLPGGGGPASIGMGGGDALTTKPRQMPGGSQGLNTPPADPGIDPASNGGDIEAGQDAETSNPFMSKLRAIASDVQRSNPHLSSTECGSVALEVLARFQVISEDVSPLLFGDRGPAPDGPLTDQVKNWAPKDITPGSKKPSEPDPQGDSDGNDDDGEKTDAPEGGAPAAGEAAEGAAGAGEAAGAAGAAGEVAELAPLLLL